MNYNGKSCDSTSKYIYVQFFDGTTACVLVNIIGSMHDAKIALNS